MHLSKKKYYWRNLREICFKKNIISWKLRIRHYINVLSVRQKKNAKSRKSRNNFFTVWVFWDTIYLYLLQFSFCWDPDECYSWKNNHVLIGRPCRNYTKSDIYNGLSAVSLWQTDRMKVPRWDNFIRRTLTCKTFVCRHCYVEVKNLPKYYLQCFRT